MAAVQIARLKKEVAALGALFSRPDELKRSLDTMLDFYADRVYRAGHSVPPTPNLLAYHVHPLVIQQIELEFQSKYAEDEAGAMALAEVLWADCHIETRRLAVFLIGQLSLEPPQAIIQCIQEWAKPGEPAEILALLFTGATTRLRKEQPAAWLDAIQAWLDKPSPAEQGLGLVALQALVEDRQFLNLPPVYRMVSGFIHSPHPRLQHALQDLLEALARRSPTETVYFLRQLLGSPTPASSIRIIRRILPLFSPEGQASLRQMLNTRD